MHEVTVPRRELPLDHTPGSIFDRASSSKGRSIDISLRRCGPGRPATTIHNLEIIWFPGKPILSQSYHYRRKLYLACPQKRPQVRFLIIRWPYERKPCVLILIFLSRTRSTLSNKIKGISTISDNDSRDDRYHRRSIVIDNAVNVAANEIPAVAGKNISLVPLILRLQRRNGKETSSTRFAGPRVNAKETPCIHKCPVRVHVQWQISRSIVSQFTRPTCVRGERRSRRGSWSVVYGRL